jgi:uncharacterized membrane protein
MSEPGRGWTDDRVENLLGNLLRAGVVLAAAVVLTGAIPYLIEYGSKEFDLRAFREEPSDLRSPAGIVRSATHLESRGVMQLGMLLLVATPVARVAFSAFAFFRQRDFTYVVLTLIVLTLLLFSLFVGFS